LYDWWVNDMQYTSVLCNIVLIYWCTDAGHGAVVALPNADKIVEEICDSYKALGINR